MTVIGTGNVARGLGRRVLAGGHELTVLGKVLTDAEEAVGEIGNDDEDAKAAVSKLAEDGGLRPVDVGPLKRARELEAARLPHMSVQGPLGTGFGSALKIVS